MLVLAFNKCYNLFINHGFSQDGGSHMQQELSMRRDQLARAHQLGELQKEYTYPSHKRAFALICVGVLVVFIITIIFSSITSGFSWEAFIILGTVYLGTFLLIGLIVGGVAYYYRGVYVCVYTDGLIYLFGIKERAVRWEQIGEVSIPYRSGSFEIDVNDGPSFTIPQISKELLATIRHEVDTHRIAFASRRNEPSETLLDLGQSEFADPQQSAPSPGTPFDPGPQVPVHPGPQPGREAGSPIPQDLPLQRDELAQAHQLGAFQRDYTIAFGKWARSLLWIGFILFGTLIPTIGRVPTLFTIILGLFYTLGIGSVVVRLIYYSFRRLHVYLYTGGLLYLNRNKWTAIRWEQITHISRGMGGAVSIDRGGPTEPRLRLTSLINGIGGLYSTIQVNMQSPYSPYSPYATAPQSTNRSKLWIILGTIVSLVVIVGITFSVGFPSRNGSTPTNTLNAYCSDLKSGNYQTAYTQLSSGLQNKIGSEAQFAADWSGNPGAFTAVLGGLTSCTVSNVNDAAGTISYTFESGGMLVQDYSLAGESSAWKINGWQSPRSSTTHTFYNFCDALLRQDYPTAYDQFSSSQQSLQSEAQFANLFIGNPVSSCMASNVDDTAGTGTITRTYANGGSNIVDFTLIVENGSWKINSRQARP